MHVFLVLPLKDAQAAACVLYCASALSLIETYSVSEIGGALAAGTPVAAWVSEIMLMPATASSENVLTIVFMYRPLLAVQTTLRDAATVLSL